MHLKITRKSREKKFPHKNTEGAQQIFILDRIEIKDMK